MRRRLEDGRAKRGVLRERGKDRRSCAGRQCDVACQEGSVGFTGRQILPAAARGCGLTCRGRLEAPCAEQIVEGMEEFEREEEGAEDGRQEAKSHPPADGTPPTRVPANSLCESPAAFHLGSSQKHDAERPTFDRWNSCGKDYQKASVTLEER